MLKLDKSKINTYLSCGYRYYLEYVKQVEKALSPALLLGSDFHYISSHFHNYINDELLNEILKRDDKLLFYSIIDWSCKEPKGDYVVNMNEELKKLIRNFVDFEYNRLMECKKQQRLDCFKPVYNEQHFEDKELMIEGVVDRVFKDFDNKLILMEIKTGNPSKYKTTAEALQRELAIYYLLLKANDIFCEKFMVYYPRVNQVVPITINDKVLGKTIRTIGKVRTNIEANIFKKDVGLKCNYCPVIKYCVNDEKKENLEEMLEKSIK
jgi:CRISPR/Cas system-associated exonuclease Cas4 (RecB family)